LPPSSSGQSDLLLRQALSRLVQAEREQVARGRLLREEAALLELQRKRAAAAASGYLRLKRAAEDGSASVKQLRAATKAHNERYCIKVGGTKAELRGRISRVAKRFDAISGGGKAKKPKPGGGGGGGGTAAQKKTAAKLTKMSKVLAQNKSGEDAFPELSF
jgi:hypothetical protein